MRMYDIIEKKRDKGELSKVEIDFFIEGYCSKTVPDYQAAALLMAIFINGMNERETADLTLAMAHSGDIIDLSSIPGIKVDKHSTGGVGDKTTLILAPIVAALGVPVAKMSGKGLGHTGGTIDKLEAIPGFQTSISREVFLNNVKNIGIAVAGQTGNLAPADKLLYALRDVTATVNNISLIASSIMSKKIASGADRIVLDVKTGSGAFMKNIDESFVLAKEMVKIADSVGRKAVALITDMDIPLGKAIGNSLEVIESIETLKGKGPADLEEVSLELAARMVELGLEIEYSKAKEMVKEVVASGAALEKFKEMIQNQGGNPLVVDDYSLFGEGAISRDYLAKEDGYISHIETDELGKASVVLGAGRETKESAIDYSAGIIMERKTGDKVVKGDVIARLITNDSSKINQAVELMSHAVKVSYNKIIKKPLILGFVDSENMIKY